MRAKFLEILLGEGMTLSYIQASNVLVLDSGDYYTGSNAEDILQEIGAILNTLAAVDFTETTGLVNAMAVTLDGYIDTANGSFVCIVPNLTNTAAATLAINGGAAKAIKKFDTTTDGYIDIVAGDLKKNNPTILMHRYSGLDDFLVLPSCSSNAGSVSISDSGNYYTGTNVETALQEVGSSITNVSKYFTSTGTVNALAVDTDGTFDLTKNGALLNVLPANTNTEAVTIAVDGQTAKSIKKYDTDSGTFINLAAGDLKKNTPAVLVRRNSGGDDFFVYAPKIGASYGWVPLSEWQDISNPAANTISMVRTDQNLFGAFTITTQGAANYTVTVTGGVGNVTINGSTVSLGTPVSIASGVQCNITYIAGTAKSTSYGYGTFQVDVTSANTLLTFAVAKNPNISTYSYSPLLWFVANANITTATFQDASNFCQSLQAIKITSSSMTTIPANAFNYLISLRSVVLPSSLTTIGNNAFEYCYSLENITLPNSITSLGQSCFRSCTALKSITLPSSLTTIGLYCFRYCNDLESIAIPSGVTTIPDYCFDLCYSLNSLTFLGVSTLTTIATNAFHNCYSLKNLTLPNSVTTLGISAFQGCYSMRTLVLSNGITSLPNYCFQDCTALRTVTLPNALITFGQSVFYNNNSLETISIPSTVTTYGYSVFTYCYNLRTVTISNTISGSYNDMFYNCPSLKEISNLQNTTGTNLEILYTGCYNLETFNAPNITFYKINLASSLERGRLHSLSFSASSTFGGSSYQIDIRNNSFSRAEIVDVFNLLPTLSGKSINVANCTGTPDLTPADIAIATGKGWTVNTV